MQNLDGTVVATALPAMAKAFGADPLRMNVALTSYLLSLAVFIPVSGWMADRFGTRTVFRAAIAVFTVGSILCGQSTGLWELVGARIVQGIGGAMMVPVGRLVLLRSVAKSELVAAMAWLTVPALIGPVIGPPLGGFLATYADWRWIFYINIPIGILGIVLVTRFIEDIQASARKRLDVVGLLLSGIALSGLLFGFETLGRGILSPFIAGGAVIAGSAGLLGYWMHARRIVDPLLDVTLMRIPTFAVSVIGGSLFRVGVGAVPYLLPLMLQLGFGRSAVQSGLITFAGSLGAIVMKPATQFALRWFGFRTTLVWNGALSAILLGACAAFSPAWPVLLIYAVLLMGGFLRSLQFTAYNTIAYADVTRGQMSAATSLYATIQQVSLTLGITIGAATLEASTLLFQHAIPITMDFAAAFLVVAGIALTAAPVSLLLSRDAGAELSGHKSNRIN